MTGKSGDGLIERRASIGWLRDTREAAHLTVNCIEAVGRTQWLPSLQYRELWRATESLGAINTIHALVLNTLFQILQSIQYTLYIGSSC